MSAVFHYAPWGYLPAIVQSGYLKPSNAGAAGEHPMLWFSSHQHWEPTAGKTWRSASGTVGMMSFRQQLARAGCIRFGLPAADPRLLTWKAACLAAGTPRDDRRAMERAGKKRGGDPGQWFAIATPVPLSELRLEVFIDGKWMPANADEMAEAWTEQRGAE